MNAAWPRLRRPAAGVLAAMASWLLVSHSAPTADQSATIAVDMQVSAGGHMELFVNGVARPPQVEVLEAGERHTYRFTGYDEDITFLRLDPTDAATSEVRLFGIDVIVGGQVVRHLGIDDFQRWAKTNIAVQADSGVFTFTSANIDPYLSTTEPMPLPPSLWREWLQPVRFLTTEQPQLAAFLFIPVAVLLFPVRQRWASLVVVGTALASAAYAVRLVQGWHLAPPDIHVALSRGAYTGQSLRTGQVAVLLSLMLTSAVGIVSGRLIRRRARSTGAPVSDSVEPVTRLLPLAGLWLVFAVWLAPDLQSAIDAMRSQVYVPHWDSDNTNYWAYLTSHGARPFRDFWYVYGGQYLFDLAWPAGPLSRWLFDTFVYGLLATGLWLLAPSRRAAALGLVVAIVLLDKAHLTPASFRYLIGIEVFIAYLVLRCADRLQAPRLLLAITTMLVATIIEWPQVLYAAPAIAAVWLIDVCCDRPKSFASWRRTLVPLAALAACGVVAMVLVATKLAASGQLDGAAGLYLSLGAMAEYGAMPPLLGDVGWNFADLRLAFLWWPIVAIGVGLHERIAANSTAERVRGLAMVGLGMLAAVVLQKHLMRPITTELAIYPLVSSFVYLLLWPRPHTRVSTIVAGSFAGVLCAMAASGGVDLEPFILGGPSRAAADASILSKAQEVSLVNRSRFSKERFRDHVDELQLVESLRRRAAGAFDVFMLTDAPVVYLLTQQSPVWMSNMYNASPVSEQERMVRWLRDENPQYAVFRRDRLDSDGVPTPLRVPRIVEAVIGAYVPSHREGPFDVLRRRQPGESVPLDFWREALGSDINLGHVPSLIDMAGRQPCEREPCDHYVAVDIGSSRKAADRATISIEVGGLQTSLQFALVPARGRYILPVSRLWFWTAVPEPSRRETVVSSPAGATVSWLALEKDARRLY